MGLGRALSRRVLGFAFGILAASVSPVMACPSDLDQSFGIGGVTEPLDPDLEAFFGQPFVQPNGGILVPGATHGVPMVMRYHEDGTLDPKFGQDGVARVLIRLSYQGGMNSVEMQADGRILASGIVGIFDGDRPIDTPILVRFDSTGELDPTFGDGGIVLLPTIAGRDVWIIGTVVRSDGIIVALGRFRRPPPDDSPQSWVSYFKADGSLDLTFGQGGVVFLSGPPQTAATAIARLDEDAIVIVGIVRDVGDTLIAKFRADGTPDPAFGHQGVRIPRTKRYEEAWSIGVDGFGRILVAGNIGSEAFPHRSSMFVRRYLQTGKRDWSYGRRGRASVGFSRLISAGRGGFAVTREGQAVVPGTLRINGSVIARFGTDGKRDRTFGRRGFKRVVAGVFAVTAQPDGKLLATGDPYLTSPSGYAPLLLRLEGGTWDGTEQCIFGCGNGVVTAPEQCDDGNALSGDGCSAACTVE